MKTKISLTAAALFASSALFADSTSITDALTNGKVSGEFAIYADQAKIKDSNNKGFGSGSFNLGYSTDSFYDFTLSAGSRANHAFWEIHSKDYEQNAKAILHTANIAYSHPHLDVVLGRQEINLNWASDFHEALVGVVKAIPDTAIVVGYTQRVATADYDSPLSGFDKLGDDGAFVVDARYNGVEGLIVNPFIYFANDVATWAGARADYDREFSSFSVGGTAQYTQSSEDNGDDGSFLHLEARGSFIGINANLGFAKTDKNGGAGSIAAAGENVNPFEDGEQLFEVDASTVYLGASYEFKDFAFSALYGYTKYANDAKFNELDLGVGYDLGDNLALQGFLIVGSGNDNAYNDYTKVTLGAVYSF
ncbi:MAG: Opr family porin [Campylobacteraceae bacterium]|nr:Opr family porin [Campylobacteraceae bacterium]